MKGSSGQRFGKYQIEYELGRGGFGTVFRAVDTTLDRPVAIKILDLLLMRDRDWVARFQREARLMARLDHPHIVHIYEIGNLEGRLFIAMKLVDGADLARHLVSTGPVPWPEALSLVGQIAGALDYAHAADLVHRDLKPSNILLADGKATLTDFGLSMMASANTMSVSLTGGLIGTPSYIAPEAWEGRDVTAAADQYALACLAYEMLTGNILFHGETPPAIMKAHYDAPRFPEAWAEDVPPGIEAVLATALAHDPEARYATCGGFADALHRLQADNLARPRAQLHPARPPGRPEKEAEPPPERQAWRTELLTKEWYASKIRVFLTRDVHVLEVKRPLGRPATVELDGEVVGENEDTPWLSWEGAFNFVMRDGNEERAATVELGTHWFHDKITKFRLIVDGLPLYDEGTT